MDILLLAAPAAVPLPPIATDTVLHGPLGMQRLRLLLAELVDRAQGVRLLAVVPPAEGELRGLLDLAALAARSYGVETTAILRAGDVAAQRLEALHTHGVSDLIVLGDAGCWQVCAAAVAVLARFRAGRAAAALSGRTLSCRLWLAPGADADHHRRLAGLARAAPWLAVDTPGFDLPPAAVPAAEPARPLPALPAELLARPAGCWLHRHSITFDAGGRLLLCPRHAGAEDGWAGDLYAHTPDELLARREAASDRVGRTAACRRCQVRGRFQWPENQPPRGLATSPGGAVETAGATVACSVSGVAGVAGVAAGAAGAAGGGTAGPGSGVEVQAGSGTVTGGAGVEELGAFEARLTAWTESLEDWDRDHGLEPAR